MSKTARAGVWARTNRGLLLLLAIVVVPPAVTLVWLGMAFASRERDSLAQRAHERQTTALNIAIDSLSRSLAQAERSVSNSRPPRGMLRLDTGVTGVVAEPDDALLWTPWPPNPGAISTALAAAEANEFRGRQELAVAAYRQFAEPPSSNATRAAALVRLARIHRTSGRFEEALTTYDRILKVPDTLIDGAPADLQARRAICDVLGQTGRTTEQRQCAESLRVDLVQGRWRATADRATWEAAAAEVARWTSAGLAVDPVRRMFSEVADLLAREHLPGRTAGAAATGWRTVEVTSATVNAFLGPHAGGALVVSADVIAGWLARAEQAIGAGARLSLIASNGKPMDGSPLPGLDLARTTPGETGLPWTIALAALPDVERAVAGQRTLLTIGLAALLTLVAGSAYFLWRTVSRELEVVRLQTEFVSAVSHEFRTPLTSMRHMSELLVEGASLSPEERQEFYASLTRNVQRLQRFVESLLDFARLEADRRSFAMRPLDAGAFVTELVADFVRDLKPRAADIRSQAGPGPLLVRADPDALRDVLWNLLDNAVKYSPERTVIDVSVRRLGDAIRIDVTDTGVGIPANEQQDIFGRFVRGRAATEMGVRGTGLGLAIVSQLVQAHRGTIDVQSVEGQGSTFTVALPGGESE